MKAKQGARTSRRTFIAGAALFATALTTGGFWLSLRPEHREAWVEDVLRRNLPGIDLDPESLATFVRRFVQSHTFDARPMKVAVWMDRTLPSIARHIPKAERRIERLERLVISVYLDGTNFFRVADPGKETIFYGGSIPACGNPFAVFRKT
jgi:hypothetical protein